MLSGTFASEVSDASGTILMDIAKRDWSDEILTGLKINKGLLPKIFESYEVSAYVDRKTANITGLKEGTPIVGGGGDNACGNVGAGIIQSGIISDSIGTSGVVFAYSDEPVYDGQGRLHSFCHAVPGKWHLMGVTLSAAGSQKWYFDTFGPSPKMQKRFPDEKGYKLLDRQAEDAPIGADGLIFLPYMSGERTPHADPFARGVFFGLSYVHNQNHFARSIMEGVAFSQKDCLALMQELGIKSKKIILIGGGAKSKIWRQIISDILETDIVTLVSEEGPAFGAALLAGVGSEIFTSVDDAVLRTVREATHIRPIDKNIKIYNKIYAIFKSLYKDLKDDYKKLYDVQFNS
jgi:xylulokinase